MDPLRKPGATGAPSRFVTAAESLETNEALDAPRRALFGFARGALPASVKELLQGRPAGHAVHPITVHVPVGAWMSAAILDWLVPDSEIAATTLTAVGLAGVLPTVATGLAEGVDADDETQRVAVVHAAANAGATTLLAGSLIARLAGSHGLGKALLLLAGGGWVIGGYLGGHMSLVRKYATHGESRRAEGELDETDLGTPVPQRAVEDEPAGS